MAQNQAATNPNPRPLLEALVDIYRANASRAFSRTEERNSSVRRDYCFPAEFNVRSAKAPISPFVGVGITYRIVGVWAPLLLDTAQTVSSELAVTGRGYAETLPAEFPTVKGELPSISEIRRCRLKLLSYAASISIRPSNFKMGEIGVGLRGPS